MDLLTEFNGHRCSSSRIQNMGSSNQNLTLEQGELWRALTCCSGQHSHVLQSKKIEYLQFCLKGVNSAKDFENQHNLYYSQFTYTLSMHLWPVLSETDARAFHEARRHFRFRRLCHIRPHRIIKRRQLVNTYFLKYYLSFQLPWQQVILSRIIPCLRNC